MSRKILASLAVAATTATLLTVSGSPAVASDVAVNGCTRIFAEYTSDANNNYIEYVEASNICEPYNGWFILGGVEGPETNPIQSFRTQGETVPRGVGGFVCAESFERKFDGSFIQRDNVCINFP